MISEREVLKRIVQFGKREYKEKKPLKLSIYRVKSKSILKRGMLPNLNVKQIGLVHFLVVLDYGESLRVYFFARDGQQLGGQNIEKAERFLKDLQKGANLQYHLPKEKLKLTLEDISASFQEEFHKLLDSINEQYGLHIKFPFTIRASQTLKVVSEITFGSIRSEEYLDISIKLYKKPLFELIALREIFEVYLRKMTGIKNPAEDSKELYTLVALQLSNYYLKNEKSTLLIKIFNSIVEKRRKTQDKQLLSFIETSLNILKKNTSILSTETRKIVFRKIFTILNIYERYQISFSSQEFISFSHIFFKLFPNILDPLNPTSIYSFHLAHYQDYQSLVLNPWNKMKSDFLILMFTMLSGSELKEMTFQEAIDYIEPSLKSLSNIKLRERMVQDALTTYIFSRLIRLNVQQRITKTNLIITLSIENPKKITFQNLNYALEWKPQKRLRFLYSEEPFKQETFKENLINKIEYTIEGKGSVTVFLTTKISSPLNNQIELKQKQRIFKIRL